MLELLAYDFMQRSLLAATLVGAVCSVIGVFVVLRGLAFAGAGTAHAAFAGVTFAYLVGLPPLGLAIVFGLAPGYVARTTTVGGTISGYSLTGNRNSDIAPTIKMISDNTPAKMGRRMKKCENFMAQFPFQPSKSLSFNAAPF